MRERIAALNPKASMKLANRLIEANERNYWNPDPAMIEALREATDEIEDRLEGLTTSPATSTSTTSSSTQTSRPATAATLTSAAA
jgi:magnesium chelatase subunit H